MTYQRMVGSGVVGLVVMVALISLGWLAPSAAVTAPAVPTTLPSAMSSSCRLPWVNGMDMASLQVVYNSTAHEFVAFGMKYHDTIQLSGATGSDFRFQVAAGLRLSPDGHPIGSPVKVISDSARIGLSALPELAYSSRSNRYLAVWGEYTDRPSPRQRPDVSARLLDAHLTPISPGSSLGISDVAGHWPSVAYNVTDDEFMVAWMDEEGVFSRDPTPTSSPPNPLATPTPTVSITPGAGVGGINQTSPPKLRGLHLSRVAADGTVVAPVILLLARETARGEVRQLRLVYNPQTQEYLLVWAQGGAEAGLYTLRVSRVGVAIGAAQRVVGPAGQPRHPQVVYNTTTGDYLLVWGDSRAAASRGMDVYGQRLTAEGAPLGTEFVIRGTAQYEAPTAVVYNAVRQEYLVAWDSQVVGKVDELDVKPSLQRLTSQGEVTGEALARRGAVFGLATNARTGDYLILEGFGFYATALGDQRPCVASPTPEVTPTPSRRAPTPTPYVVQWEGQLLQTTTFDLNSQGWWLSRLEGDQRSLERVTITEQTRIDDSLGRPEVGAQIWVTLHETIWGVDNGGPIIDHVAETIAVVAAAPTPTATREPDATATPTATSTPTPTAPPSSTPTPTATRPAPRYTVYVPLILRNDEP